MKYKRLVEEHKNNGITYSEIAQKLGITYNNYYLLIKGKRKMSYERAITIAKEFNKKPDDIFYDDCLDAMRYAFENKKEDK